LKQVADKTGGKYYRADSTDTLRAIYDEIDKQEKTEVEVKKFVQYEELFPWVVLPGLGILMLEVMLGHTLWRRLP
jgi:Ca-activated chloride channel homolog